MTLLKLVCTSERAACREGVICTCLKSSSDWTPSEIKNDSPKRSYKWDGIRVRIRLRAFPYYSDCTYDSITYDLVKTRLLESEAA